MILRHLNQKQSSTLNTLVKQGGIPAMSLRRYDIALETIYALKREKLVTETNDARYSVTEAGSAALDTGLYEKQPQLLIIAVSSAPKKHPSRPAPAHNGRSA